jgi:hypothetical protein
MARTSNSYPNTAADDAAVGTLTWLNVDGIKDRNNNGSATITPTSGTQYSNYLKATNFGFAIPSSATINGIWVGGYRGKGTFCSVYDHVIKLIKDDGSLGTINKANTSAEWNSYGEDWEYGGVSDTWDEMLTPSVVNSPNFGVAIQVKTEYGQSGYSGSLDYVVIAVYYTDSPESIKARPFAVNTGNPITGTIQLGKLAIGITEQPYCNGIGGVTWYNGPDETPGYIIAKDVGTKPTFWRSASKSYADFIAIVNVIRGVRPYYTRIAECTEWLSANGYYTTYEE